MCPIIYNRQVQILIAKPKMFFFVFFFVFTLKTDVVRELEHLPTLPVSVVQSPPSPPCYTFYKPVS